MSIKNSASTYGSVAKFFHWLIFVLLLFMVILGYCLDDVPKLYRPFATNLHKLTGLLILLLMLLRAAWALINPKPLLPNARAWEYWAAYSVHGLLYVTVIAMPLVGWIASNAADHPPYLGHIVFSLPIAQNKALADAAFDLHGNLAIAIIILFVIHVLAAFYHYFIKKDDVLQRML